MTKLTQSQHAKLMKDCQLSCSDTKQRQPFRMRLNLRLNSRHGSLLFGRHSVLMLISTWKCQEMQFCVRILVRLGKRKPMYKVCILICQMFICCLFEMHVMHSNKHPLMRFFTLSLPTFAILQSLKWKHQGCFYIYPKIC